MIPQTSMDKTLVDVIIELLHDIGDRHAATWTQYAECFLQHLPFVRGEVYNAI
jgi:hypothetical protein